MDPTQRVIVVEGVGVEPVDNDRCVVTVALKITREHAADALQEMSALADKVVSLLHDSGVESSSIATQNVTIQEYYDPQSQRVAGQQATYTLAIGLPDLEGAAKVLQKLSAIARNALQVLNVAPTTSQVDTGRAAARARAVQDAQARAAQLAEAAGVALGALLSIEESTLPLARPFAPTAVRLAAAPMPIEGGTQDVTVRVTLTYAIAD